MLVSMEVTRSVPVNRIHFSIFSLASDKNDLARTYLEESTSPDKDSSLFLPLVIYAIDGQTN